MKALPLCFMTFAGLLAGALSPAVLGQVLPDVLPSVERQTERVQERATERVQQQAESARNQASEQIQNRATEQAQGQAVEQVQNRAENVTEQAQQQIDRAQNAADRISERLPQAAEAAQERVGRTIPGAAVGRGLEQAAEASGSALPERLSIPDQEGNPAFVEITIAPNIRAIEYEWVMMLSEPQRQRMNDEAPELMQYLEQTRPFDAVDGYILTFRIPPDLDADDAVMELVPEDLRHLIDRNHVYSAQADSGKNGKDRPEQKRTDLSLPMDAVCTDPLAVGIIDSVVNTEHEAFNAIKGRQGLIHRNFIQQDISQPNGHGTAVSGLLVGEGPGLNPLLPAARVYSASVIYSQDPYHQGTTVVHLLEALDWLMGEELAVINMSLTGPDNRLLAEGIRRAQDLGKVIVAAAGNEGPHAPPRYPAAYDGVISATAVARDGAIYRWANQGEHIDFAAIGVSVPTARGDGSFGHESGTSIASPVISAFMACALAANGNDPGQARSALEARSIDLGQPGHDTVFGHGLLHP